MYIIQVFYKPCWSSSSSSKSLGLVPSLYIGNLHLDLLEGIFNRIILAHHNLLLLFCADMLHPYLLCQFARKFANESRVPEFAGYAQILAAPHQRIGFASFGGRGDAIRVEILLLAAGYGNKSGNDI
jgi:hypothetical protein